MQKITLRILTISGLILGTSAIASASPATHLIGRDAGAHTTSVQRADYTWNHHHYKHRSWDKKGNHWHYY
jgi:hypothetical protein